MKILALVLAVMLMPGVAFGAEASPWTQEDGYTDKMMAKLDYGVKNLLGGWTEIIRQPVQAQKDDGSVGDVLKSVGSGIWDGVAYTLGGVIHTATFLCTATDVPIPDGGVDL